MGSLLILSSILLFLSNSIYKWYYIGEWSIMIYFPILGYLIFICINQRFLKFILLLALHVIEIAESISILTTGSTFNLQFYHNAKDVRFAIFDMPVIFVNIVIFIIALIVYVFLMSSYVRSSMALRRYVIIFCFLYFVFMFKKSVYIYKVYCPFIPNPFEKIDPVFYRKFKKFSYSPISVDIKNKKNLVVIILESFELKNIGTYNKKFPNLMPFLSHLSRTTTIFDNIQPQPRTTSSLTSSACCFCSFPVFIHKMHMRNTNLKCITDFLYHANYTNYMVSSFVDAKDHLYQFFGRHHCKTLSSAIHHQKFDEATINWTIHHLLPKLSKKQPFSLVFYSVNTHLGKFKNICPKQYQKYNSKHLNEWECADIWLKQFYYALKKMSYYDQTEFIIYGDHNKDYQVCNRSQVIVLPKHKYGNISKQITYYDFSRIVGHLLNMKTSPEYIFGNDPFSPNYTQSYPNQQHLTYLFNRFSQ